MDMGFVSNTPAPERINRSLPRTMRTSDMTFLTWGILY